MERVEIKGWVVEFDREATLEAYAAYRNSYSPCTCDYCRNYRLVREGRLPEDLVGFANQVGIDLSLEGEVSQTHQRADGLHGYGGWFHFVGRPVMWPASTAQSEHGISFDPTPVPLPDAFPKGRTFHVSFYCYLPWHLDALEPQ